MHRLIPFAAPLSEVGREAARGLSLPRLGALLALLTPHSRDDGDEWSLSTPHERALARELGLAGADGALPWGARAAAADGVSVGDLAWGLINPTHWHLGTDQCSMADPSTLMLDETDSHVLFNAVSELFTSEGFVFAYGAASRWYVAHEDLAGLACASPDRVIGRNVDLWLGKDVAMRRLRRLQSEVQMSLYTHPLNEQRLAQGLAPVNSFWLSGCGVAQPHSPGDCRVDDRLRTPALADDWAAWGRAWLALDAGPLAAALDAARQGQAVRLTLCGERSSATFTNAPRSLLSRLRTAWSRPEWLPLLESL